MKQELLGPSCSILTALVWGFAVVLFKPSGERIPPMVLNLFKTTVGLVLLAVTLVVTGDGYESIRHFPRADIYILFISGIIGITVADTIFFHSLNLVGVGISAIVDCMYSPLIILCSWVMLAERVTVSTLAGAGLILTGVLVASSIAPPRNRTRGQIVLGVFLGAVSMAMMAYGILLAKLVFDNDQFPLMWAATLRMAAGTVLLALLMAASPRRREHYAVFRPSAVWKLAVPASVLGAYISMILWVAGFKYTPAASVAGILNQTSTIFAIILATVFLKERFTVRKLVAVVLALGGVVLVTVPPKWELLRVAVPAMP